MAGRSLARGGFTVIELMIAIAILLIAVLGTFSTQLVSNDLERTTRETATGVSDLQAAMEQILLRSPDQIPILGSPYRANQPIVAFNGLHLRNERIVPTYPGYAGGSTVPDPLQIQLTLTWNDFRNRGRTLRLACVRTR